MGTEDSKINFSIPKWDSGHHEHLEETQIHCLLRKKIRVGDDNFSGGNIFRKEVNNKTFSR